VNWVDRDHPISRGFPPEFQADDELYHKLDLGHDLQAMSQPGFVEAFARGTEWAAGLLN
jgi:hypothetical protein